MAKRPGAKAAPAATDTWSKSRRPAPQPGLVARRCRITEIILILLMLFALYIILPETKPTNVNLRVLDYKKTILLVILMILYGIFILRAGYFLSTSIFLVLSYIVLGERKWLWIFTLSFPFVAVFMYLLHGLLNIYLRDPFLKFIGIMG